MIFAVLFAFAAGFYLGTVVGRFKTWRDEGTRPHDAILKQQERVFSDQSGGYSVLDHKKQDTGFFDDAKNTGGVWRG